MIKWKIVAKWLKKAYALNNNQKIVKTVLRFLDPSLLLQHKIFIYNFLITQYVSEIKIANPYAYILFILSREKITDPILEWILRVPLKKMNMMLNMISFLGAQFLSTSRGYKKKTDKKFILAHRFIAP